MLNMVPPEPAPPTNDTGTYFRLDESLEPVACNRLEWDAFQKSGAATVATTFLGAFASVITTFEGMDDGFDEAGRPASLHDDGPPGRAYRGRGAQDMA